MFDKAILHSTDVRIFALARDVAELDKCALKGTMVSCI